MTTTMTTPPLQEDLFGNPVTPADPADTTPADDEAAGRSVNDMDLTHTVLADIASDTGDPLHIDDTGRVRRCARPAPTPVPEDEAVVVTQLLAARYLTTRRDPCTSHGPVVAATQAGRNAVHRWTAYHRPPTWGATPDTPTTATPTEMEN